MYISEPLPDLEGYSFEWSPKRWFVEDKEYVKKQYFYIHYDKDEYQEEDYEENFEEKMKEVKDIGLTESQRQELQYLSKCFDRDVLCGDDGKEFAWRSVRNVFAKDFKSSAGLNDSKIAVSTTREIIFSLFRSKDDNLILACSSLVNILFEKTSKEMLNKLLYEAGKENLSTSVPFL